MAAPYSGKAIANAFLNAGVRDDRPVDHMKLQKLIYFTHGYHLALADGLPLLDELFEAWTFGPVLPSVYHEFKGFGAQPITRLATEYKPSYRRAMPVPPPADDPITEKIVDFVWRHYSQLPSIQLSNLTHKTTGPWYNTLREEGATKYRNKDIDNRLIHEYFSKLVNA